MVSVGGREPTSVEEAVEGIRLGGRTVHILVSFAFRFMGVENEPIENCLLFSLFRIRTFIQF